MTKKFKLTSNSIDISEANVTVYQIEALRDFGNVKKVTEADSSSLKTTYLKKEIVWCMINLK